MRVPHLRAAGDSICAFVSAPFTLMCVYSTMGQASAQETFWPAIPAMFQRHRRRPLC